MIDDKAILSNPASWPNDTWGRKMCRVKTDPRSIKPQRCGAVYADEPTTVYVDLIVGRGLLLHAEVERFESLGALLTAGWIVD